MSGLSKTDTDIVIFITDLGSGGAQRVACALAKHWISHNRTVSIVTLSEPEHDFFSVPDNVIRKTLGLNTPSSSFAISLIRNFQRIWRLRRVFLELKPAVAIGFIGPAAVLVVAAAIGTNIRTIAAERNDPSRQSFGKIWDVLCYFAYRYADRITVNSTGAHAALSKKFTPDQIMLAPNPIPPVTSGPTPQLAGPTILFVGRLHPQKGVDYLVRAFAALTAPDWHLLIVGEGTQLANLEAMSEELGIDAQITFTGAVQDPTPYYRSADIFVLPSRYEGTPNALMEAMCHGLPVVISDASSGPLDLVEESDAGIVTSTGDVHALMHALQRLINDSALRKRLGANAWEGMEKKRKQDKSYKLWDAALDFSR